MLGMLPKVFGVAGDKSSDTLRSSDKPTCKSMIGASVLMIELFIFSIMAGLVVEILFMLFSVYNAV